MKYGVVYESSAERDLTEIWLRSRLRYAITQAADRIDAELSSNPRGCGESREGDRRVLYVWPMGVSYKIDEDQQRVRVISVWKV